MKNQANFKISIVIVAFTILILTTLKAQIPLKDYPSELDFAAFRVQMARAGDVIKKTKGKIYCSNDTLLIKYDNSEEIAAFKLTSKGIYNSLRYNMHGYVYTAESDMYLGSIKITEVYRDHKISFYEMILPNGWVQRFYKQ